MSEPKFYHVSWFVDVEAISPEAAAEQTLAMQRDTGSIATIFTIDDVNDGWSYHVDASNGEVISSHDWQPSAAQVASVLREVTDRLGVVIECDNEDHGGASGDDVAAYEKARQILAQLVLNKLTGESSWLQNDYRAAALPATTATASSGSTTTKGSTTGNASPSCRCANLSASIANRSTAASKQRCIGTIPKQINRRNHENKFNRRPGIAPVSDPLRGGRTVVQYRAAVGAGRHPSRH